MSVHAVRASPSDVTQARLVLAWAILRLRHPILASVGLVDSFGKVSYSYDPPETPTAAVLEAETSLEFRTNISDLTAFYKAGSRRVSRSHLSHLIVATSATNSIISPPPTPPLSDQGALPIAATKEVSFLLCTPHYVADSQTLASHLEELVVLLTRHSAGSDSSLEAALASELKLAASKQPPPPTLKPVSPPMLKMRLPREARFQRSVHAP